MPSPSKHLKGMLPRILVIVGPTASGKTSLALAVADRCKSEIVSADSRQVYKYLDIGTAKPTVAERKKVKHHFVDILEPDQEYSAGRFGLQVRDIILEIVKKGHLPILVGGSGLYVKAAIDGLFDGPGKDPEIRLRLEQQCEIEGLGSLVKTLREVDHLALEAMKEVTPRRVIRALEVYQITGRPISEFRLEENTAPAYEAYQVGLQWEREELYQRINDRADSMIASGLEAEVQALMARGYDRHLNALNTVGYKEVFDFYAGSGNHSEMIELIKRNSRRFAKRQMTWFNGDRRIHWMRITGDDWLETAADKIVASFSKARERVL